MLSYTQVLHKIAAQQQTTAAQDWASSGPADLVIGSFVPSGPVGTILGAAAPAQSARELAHSSVANPIHSIIPAMGDYKLARRRTAVAKALGHGKHQTAYEITGQLLSSITGATLGGLGAYLLARHYEASPLMTHGAVFGGASLGYALPAVVGALAAGISRQRTLKEQHAYEHGGVGQTVANLTVPGAAFHNYYKGVGVSQRLPATR